MLYGPRGTNSTCLLVLKMLKVASSPHLLFCFSREAHATLASRRESLDLVLHFYDNAPSQHTLQLSPSATIQTLKHKASEVTKVPLHSQMWSASPLNSESARFGDLVKDLNSKRVSKNTALRDYEMQAGRAYFLQVGATSILFRQNFKHLLGSLPVKYRGQSISDKPVGNPNVSAVDTNALLYVPKCQSHPDKTEICNISSGMS